MPLTRFLVSRLLLATLLVAAGASAVEPASGPVATEEPIEFTAGSGETVAAFRGEFIVPSNWNRPGQATLRLAYVRFPASGAAKGPPIVYLAGGPGGSGIDTARGPRFALFMAMREFGDVIAFDQRGTGASSRQPTCTSTYRIDDATAYSDLEYADLHRAAARQCLQQWQRDGLDLRDWTTAQSVHDLDALRRHLGADKLSLWGISYGSHLALAAITAMEDRLERVVLASVEGLDQTVKRPAETDAYFTRLQAAIDTRPELASRFPDVVGLMRRVLARLEAEPLLLRVTPTGGAAYDFLLERRDLQQLASGMIADPSSALQLLELFAALDAGETAPIAWVLGKYHRAGEAIDFNPMPLGMDLASGISRRSLDRFEREAKAAILGGYLNFPMPQLDLLVPGLDLGDRFRRDPRSCLPVLVLIGTLDGRTYPDGQREAVRGLSNAEITVVVNAGHNLFMTSPEVTGRIQSFMRGEQSALDRIVVDGWSGP
ncbi:alpha/beta fold hydrolase [Luteimonas viscosa]|uniref:Proline iminopeptidase n=1 Tax=Luteimonas viscosa TaxID=1132694 RepID=A0A5D4XPL0_9GAMM|nr:alpha/beta hydrolase [Luteimonas viscosa]TYT26607.1 alpha/beta fold hydrolase [Luteimonas viscosa]